MKQQIINKLRGFFSLQPIEKAWVFGSCSRGEETKDSDIDILVRFDSHARITLFKYAGMVEALSQLLHRKVDLVEEGQLKDFRRGKNVLELEDGGEKISEKLAGHQY